MPSGSAAGLLAARGPTADILSTQSGGSCSQRKEKSSAENESAEKLPWMMCPPLCARNHNLKLTSLKKKMAQMSSVRNKQKREALLQHANALLADMTEAPAK
jgi:hypothetical protein